MKNTLLLFGLAGITSALLSFTFIPKNDEVQEPKKVRHIKMTKIVDGKKSELDTTVANDQVFIWQGDTIGGKEMIHHGKDGEPMIRDMGPDTDFDVFSEGLGDSIRKKIFIHERIGDRDMDHMMFINGPGHLPVPPVPHIKMIHQKDGRMIDLNDKNIISYRKKDMSGNREKIEIIRKKTKDSEQSFSFDFDGSGQLMPPPPPPMPPHVPNVPGMSHEKIEKDHKVDIEVEKEENK
jgi:hypothetical protein